MGAADAHRAAHRELWAKLKKTRRAVDIRMQHTQGLVCKAAIPKVLLMDKLLNTKDSQDKEAWGLASDAFRLLSLCLHSLSMRRGKLIVPEIGGVGRNLANPNNPVTQFLFGDDLAKQIRHFTKAQKLSSQFGSQYTPTHGKKPYARGDGW